MKLLSSPSKFFWIGLVCVVLGFALPLLIILGFIENTFALSFFIYILQLVGMIMGIIAATGFAVNKRAKEELKKRKEQEKEQEDIIGWME